MNHICNVCEGMEWLDLPDPHPARTVTTSARLVEQPLGKSVCLNCGLTQRVRSEFLGLTSFYETDYASYFERPGTEKYHSKRYQQLVGWMIESLQHSLDFKKVLDVGCGQGWAMDALASHYQNIKISGIEPSHHNSAIARKKGHNIVEGKIEEVSIDVKYDLIYSNNVIQHTNNAKSFISDARNLLKDDGIIIITCPDGSNPNIELFFCDHNYSFLPENLIALGKELGFTTTILKKSKENPALPPAQLLLLTNNDHYRKDQGHHYINNGDHIRSIAQNKSRYIGLLDELETYLSKKISGYSHVFNFGASFWTSVLAGYFPDYWRRVEACIVDKNDGGEEFIGKEIIEVKDIEQIENAIVVLGTSPATHDTLDEKLKDRFDIVRWDSFYRH